MAHRHIAFHHATITARISHRHVYYPRELELLFRLTGFVVERRYGDYDMHPLAVTSRALVVVGRRPGGD